MIYLQRLNNNQSLRLMADASFVSYFSLSLGYKTSQKSSKAVTMDTILTIARVE